MSAYPPPSSNLTSFNTNVFDSGINTTSISTSTLNVSGTTITNNLTINQNCNVSGNITVNGAINGTVSNATVANSVAVTDDNSATTSYLTFTQSSGTGNKVIYADTTTGPLTYVPSTGLLTSVGLLANAALNLATFSTSTLFLPATSASEIMSTCILSPGSSINISTLAIGTHLPNNGVHKCLIFHNSPGWTIFVSGAMAVSVAGSGQTVIRQNSTTLNLVNNQYCLITLTRSAGSGVMNAYIIDYTVYT